MAGVVASAIPKGREWVAQMIIESAQRNGFSYDQAMGFLANAIAESRLSPTAAGDPSAPGKKDYASFGLFQFNTRNGLGVGHDPKKLIDPQYNIDLMMKSARAAKVQGATAAEFAAELVRKVEKPKDTQGEAVRRAQAASILAGNPYIKSMQPITPPSLPAVSAGGSVAGVAAPAAVAGIAMPEEIAPLNIEDLVAQAQRLAVAPELPSVQPYIDRATAARNAALQQQLAALDASYQKAQNAMTATRDEFTGRITDLQDQGQRYAASAAGLFNNGANGAVANYNADLAANQAGSASMGFAAVPTSGPELLNAQTAADRQYMAQVYSDLQNQLANDIAAGGQLVVGSGRNAIDVARQQAGSKAQQATNDAIAELTANMLNQQYANEAEVAAQGPTRFLNALNALGGLAGTNAEIRGKNIGNRMAAQTTNADIEGRNRDRTLTAQTTSAEIAGRNLDRNVNIADLVLRRGQYDIDNAYKAQELSLRREEQAANALENERANQLKQRDLEATIAKNLIGTGAERTAAEKRSKQLATATSTLLGVTDLTDDIVTGKAKPGSKVDPMTLAAQYARHAWYGDDRYISPTVAKERLRQAVKDSQYYEGYSGKQSPQENDFIVKQQAAVVKEYMSMIPEGMSDKEGAAVGATLEKAMKAEQEAAAKAAKK